MRKHSKLLIPLTACTFALMPTIGQAQLKDADSAKDYSKSSVVTRLMAFDKNGDGKLTNEEVTDPRLQRLFDQADTTKSGVVTKDQLMVLAAKLESEAGQNQGGPGGFGGPPPGGPGGVPGGPGGRRGPGEHAPVDLSKLPPVSSAKGVTFEKDIKPLFAASCVQCHKDERAKADLRLNSIDAVLTGSENGKVVIAGDSKKSSLVIAVAQLDDESAMPPKRGPGGGFGGGPPGVLATQFMKMGEKGATHKLTKEQFLGVSDAWFDQMDSAKSGSINAEQLATRLAEMMPMGGPRGGRPGGEPGAGNPPPRGEGGAGGGQPRPGGRGFNPIQGMARNLFAAADADKGGAITRVELKNTFGTWFTQWDKGSTGSLTEDSMRAGLASVLFQGNIGPGQQAGGPGGGRGFGGPGGPGGGAPAKPLTAAQVGLVRAWIDQGAK